SEIARRQTWDLAFGRTLTALAGDGALERVLHAGLTEASLPVGATVAVCFRVAEGGELLCIGGTTEPSRIRTIAEAASSRAASALASRHTLVLDGPWEGKAWDGKSQEKAWDLESLSSAPTPMSVPAVRDVRCAALALVPLVVGER